MYDKIINFNNNLTNYNQNKVDNHPNILYYFQEAKNKIQSNPLLIELLKAQNLNFSTNNFNHNLNKAIFGDLSLDNLKLLNFLNNCLRFKIFRITWSIINKIYIRDSI
jgi:hypothetical protein